MSAQDGLPAPRPVPMYPEDGSAPLSGAQAAEILDAGGSLSLAGFTITAAGEGGLTFTRDGRSTTFATLDEFDAALAAARDRRSGSDPVGVAREAGRVVGQAAPALSAAQSGRLRVLLRTPRPTPAEASRAAGDDDLPPD